MRMRKSLPPIGHGLAEWRPAAATDLDEIQTIGDEIHVDLPERPEVFTEKFNLFPEGCFVLAREELVVGYGFSHPWLLKNIPPLDTFLGSLPQSTECLFIHDVVVQRSYSDKGLSRRTAERLRDAIERLFPQVEQVNPGEVPKRWRLPGGSSGGLANISADELAGLTTAVAVLRRDNMHAQADSTERIISKMRALLKRPTIVRLEPDLEALTEAEGLAMRPGPRPKINPDVVGVLRQAILGSNKVKLHYLYRGSGKHGFGTVHPYGFLYGNRHYLVAWSESDQARNFRNFALSNIERVELLDKTFARKHGFSLAVYAQRSLGVFDEVPLDVVWKITSKAARDAQEFLFHPSQSIELQADGSVIVSFRAGGLLEMAWHLFTWGDQVEILKPTRLRTILQEQLTAIEQACSNVGKSRKTGER